MHRAPFVVLAAALLLSSSCDSQCDERVPSCATPPNDERPLATRLGFTVCFEQPIDVAHLSPTIEGYDVDQETWWEGCIDGLRARAECEAERGS